MPTYEERFRRTRLLRAHSCQVETLVGEAKDIVLRGIQPVARLPLRGGQVGRRRGQEKRGIDGAVRGI
eukprot:1699575-Pleurochrysis_carterae.AAC.1